eukprot:348952_1
MTEETEYTMSEDVAGVTPVAHGDEKEEEEENMEEELALLSGLEAGGVDKDKPTVIRLKTPDSDEKEKHFSDKRAIRRAPSNLHKVERYRTKSQLNRAGKKEFDLYLNENLLPESRKSG